MGNFIKAWIGRIHENTAEFKAVFGGLSAEQLNWKPDASVWSIAQNLDHLIKTNQSYYPIFEGLRATSYKPGWTRIIPGLPGFFGKMILGSVEPSRRKKIKTFSVWQPEQSDFPQLILKDFSHHQNKLSQHIELMQSLFGTNRLISSPANRAIVYPLDTAIEIIILHQQRHLEQAKEVLELMKKES